MAEFDETKNSDSAAQGNEGSMHQQDNTMPSQEQYSPYNYDATIGESVPSSEMSLESQDRQKSPLQNHGEGLYGNVNNGDQLSQQSSYMNPGYSAEGQAPYTAPMGSSQADNLTGSWVPPSLPPWSAYQQGMSPQSHSNKMYKRLLASVMGVALIAGGLGAGLGIAFGGGHASTSALKPINNTPASSGVTNSGNVPTSSLAPQASSSTNLVQKVANEVEPAVVDINTVVESENLGSEQAAGTGMIISSSGLIMTNNHVINQAEKITVTIHGYSGSYPAHVLGEDPTDDVALIKVDGLSHLPTVTFANSSKVTLGEGVIAIGNALGQGGTPTVVTGEVSALGRTIQATDQLTTVAETLHNMIQTTAPIEPGDSGGPLVNTSGQVIGMDTAALTASVGSTQGYAIPSNRALRLVGDIEANKAVDGVQIGVPAFLGIFYTPPTSNSAANPFNPFGGLFGNQGSLGGSSGPTNSGQQTQGVVISALAQGGAAQRAGLVVGDTITALNGVPTPTGSALHAQIAKFKPGDSVNITYISPTGTTGTVTVTLDGLPD